MKTRTSYRLILFCGALLLAALACQSSFPTGVSPTVTIVSVSPTAGVTAPAPEPAQTGLVPVNLPAKRSDQASDVNSSVDATKRMAPGGDSFVNGLYERPFNANTMDTYFPYLDIVDTQAFKDDTWAYASITLAGADSNGKLPGKYGVELDLNRDGRGDWLVLASGPASTDWTTQGVQAWKDTDGDVGGVIPMVADRNPSNGDGYETLVFDQGHGDNVDGAWVRVAPTDPKTIDIAIKLSMLGDPKSYAVGAWAGTAALNPAKFDLNDSMTHIVAGSPLPGLQVYPLKALAEVDNTCRLAVGFAPTGNEPGLCKTIIIKQQQESGAPPASCPPCISITAACPPCP